MSEYAIRRGVAGWGAIGGSEDGGGVIVRFLQERDS